MNPTKNLYLDRIFKFKRQIRHLLVIFIALSSFGCTTLSKVDSDTVGPNKGEAIVVIGVRPNNAAPGFFPGEEKDKRFIRNSEFGVGPQREAGAFKLFRVKAETLYGFTQTVIHSPNWLEHYNACGDGPTVTFRVAEGAIVYLGNFSFDETGATLIVRVKDNFDAAAAFIREAYPKLNDKLSRAEIKEMPPSEYCILYFSGSKKTIKKMVVVR